MKDIILQKISTLSAYTIPKWLQVNPEVKQWIEDQTQDFSDIKITQRIHIILNGLPPKCECGNYCELPHTKAAWLPASIVIEFVRYQNDKVYHKSHPQALWAVPALTYLLYAIVVDPNYEY